MDLEMPGYPGLLTPDKAEPTEELLSRQEGDYKQHFHNVFRILISCFFFQNTYEHLNNI